MKKLTAWIIAFTVMLVALFTTGIFTLGSTKDTGEGFEYSAGTTACWNVSLATGDALDSVYVNIGAVHAPAGEEVSFAMKYSTSSASALNTGFKKLSEPIVFHNEKDGVNYNWLCVAEGKMLKNVARILLTSETSFKINEIVCFNKDGKFLKLDANLSVSDYEKADLSKVLDAEESFTKETGSRYIFTAQEGRIMSSVDNVLTGKGDVEGVYILASEYNYLSTLFTAGSVALFGNSTFALRLPSLIAVAVFCLFAFLFIRLLTKSDLTAFFSVALLLACGVGIGIARIGVPQAMIASAIMASLYFAYRFFASGIASSAVVKGSLNIFFSGIFGALAFAMDATSVLPLLGVGAVLAFGWRRQYLAYKLAKEKENANVRALALDYNKKTRFSVCFALLSFVAFGFLLLVGSTALCYPAILRRYGAETGFGNGLWKGVYRSFLGRGVIKTAGAGSVLSWFLSVGAIKEQVGWFILSALGLLSLCALTAIIVRAFVKGEKGKAFMRLFRTLCVCVGGLVTALIAGLIKPDVSGAFLLIFTTAQAILTITVIVWGIEKLIRRKK